MSKIKLSQTTLGKAYEYACMQAISNAVGKTRRVHIVYNSSYDVAKNAWDIVGTEQRNTMTKSARAGVTTLLQLEPKITEDGNDDLELSLQPDNMGIVGDVRDVLIIRRSISWEIGISVKHNHSAIKHSRISQTIDFGHDWFGIPNSQTYFNEIRPIFNMLSSLKQQSVQWKDIADKQEIIYVPLLHAFMRELKNLDAAHIGVIPARLLEYLLGRKDFYKIISNDNNKLTTLQCFNLHGTLNTPTLTDQPVLKIRGVGLPTRIYHLDFQNDKQGNKSLTTIQIVMDNNWAITLRIHSASTIVETSLKFDIQLTGVPSTLFSNSTSW